MSVSLYMPEGPKPEGTTSFRRAPAEGAQQTSTPKRPELGLGFQPEARLMRPFFLILRDLALRPSKSKRISHFTRELAKRFSDKTPTTVNEMMKRLDDFVRSERSFAKTELPTGKTEEQHRKSYFPLVRKDDRPFRNNNHVTD
ncbi:hypothetical protein Tco_1212188 [Tanacetum coccineum]